jgi:hypothetical protein
MTDDTNYHNATLAELIGFAGADTLTGDVVVFAFKESDIGAFIEIVTGDLVTDPDTGEETVRDQVIRMTPADARTLATRLLVAAEELAPKGTGRISAR